MIPDHNHLTQSDGRCELGKCLGDFSKCRILVRNYPPRAPHSWVSRDGLEKSRSLAAGGGIWCLRAWCECQRTQFLLGEGVKAQVVKSGLRPLALGRWVVHHIPSRSERDLGKRSGVTLETGNVVHSKPNANTKTAHPAKNFNRVRCLNSAEDVGFEPTRVVKPARVPGV